jgi:hypothetical protein
LKAGGDGGEGGRPFPEAGDEEDSGAMVMGERRDSQTYIYWVEEISGRELEVLPGKVSGSVTGVERVEFHLRRLRG